MNARRGMCFRINKAVSVQAEQNCGRNLLHEQDENLFQKINKQLPLNVFISQTVIDKNSHPTSLFKKPLCLTDDSYYYVLMLESN